MNALALRRQFLARLLAAVAVGSVPCFAQASAYEDFFWSVKMDDPAGVKALLIRGFDPNAIEPVRGDTGLVLAVREGSMKAFEVLLNAHGINLDAKAYNGDNALMLASYKHNKPVVEALLAKGAEVNRPGWTPLHYAASVGDNEIVQILLDHYAYIDAESPNKTTPIMMAARGGHILTVKLLLDAGADATLKNDLGMTAIDFAEKFEFQDIAEGLTYRLKKAGKL